MNRRGFVGSLLGMTASYLGFWIGVDKNQDNDISDFCVTGRWLGLPGFSNDEGVFYQSKQSGGFVINRIPVTKQEKLLVCEELLKILPETLPGYYRYSIHYEISPDGLRYDKWATDTNIYESV